MSTSHHRPRSQSPSNVFAERASSDTDTDETLDDGDNTKDRYWRAITELTHTVNGLSSTLSKLSRLQQTTSDSTGWGLLEKTVRGYDEDRIKASTDNIDTLLLFLVKVRPLRSHIGGFHRGVSHISRPRRHWETDRDPSTAAYRREGEYDGHVLEARCYCRRAPPRGLGHPRQRSMVR
ncbi:hypothetical protein PsYK624_040400 [Phanerochaete sordida]|uniref:Uncharacterized protein n=1 Tax=Phanerochaete sordida TaxID=48140 RepID=A0A9P3LBL4_9APHY|nr:hypothetical protein PsYK624_040400 [Phanerochaete sordida]